jgi:hypothetical protein
VNNTMFPATTFNIRRFVHIAPWDQRRGQRQRGSNAADQYRVPH